MYTGINAQNLNGPSENCKKGALNSGYILTLGIITNRAHVGAKNNNLLVCKLRKTGMRNTYDKFVQIL